MSKRDFTSWLAFGYTITEDRLKEVFGVCGVGPQWRYELNDGSRYDDVLELLEEICTRCDAQYGLEGDLAESFDLIITAKVGDCVTLEELMRAEEKVSEIGRRLADLGLTDLKGPYVMAIGTIY